MWLGPRRKKALYLAGTRKNKDYELWTTSAEKECYEQILKPYDGSSSDEEVVDPLHDLSDQDGKHFYVHQRRIYYGNKHTKTDLFYESVSDLPIEHKILARSGYTQLTGSERSFIRGLSEFIRGVNLSITQGSFDCVVNLTSTDKSAKDMELTGDRPFPYYSSSDSRELFKLSASLKFGIDNAKIVDFMGFSDRSSGSSSASQHMPGEYLYLACETDDSDDAEYHITRYISNSGKFTDDAGYGRDLCFSSAGFVTTISYKAFRCLGSSRRGEPVLIALHGSTLHTTYHQRKIIYRLLSFQNINVDLEQYEGTYVHVLSRNEHRLARYAYARIEKLGRAIRRGVMGGTFRSTRELSDALNMDNQDLIVVLRHGMCSARVKGAVCFGSTVERDEDTVIELKKGAYVETGAQWFRIHSCGIL